jgi:uncharacterized phage-like protein YoqJ
MKIMVTGHRKIVPAGLVGNPYPDRNPAVKQHQDAVCTQIVEFLKAIDHAGTPIEYITGMAIGADQLFACAALHLNDGPVVAAVPFPGQEGNWPPAAQEQYRDILNRCQVHYVSDAPYTPAKMQIRNQWMVDRADAVLAVWNGTEKGGTWNCIQSALKAGMQIIQLNPATLEWRKLK